MVPLLDQGSGIMIMTARGSSIPLITRNSSVLSIMAESEPAVLTTGSTLCSSLLKYSEDIVSSRASILSAFPRMVLISPLCTIIRLGCALSQLGFVFVLNLECTVAIADS